MAEYKELDVMREGDIPIERVVSGTFSDINDQACFSDHFEEVDISDLWEEDEKEMRRKFERSKQMKDG